MTELWPFLCQMLADPTAARVLAAHLQALPHVARSATTAYDPDADPGLRDLQHARVWRQLQHDIERENP